MNIADAAIWLGLLVEVALLVWFILSVRVIKGYLRRIALSLPVSPEQMRLIKNSISTKEAMALAEKAGVGFQVKESVDYDGRKFEALHDGVVKSNTHSLDPELLQILNSREEEVCDILKARRKSNP